MRNWLLFIVAAIGILWGYLAADQHRAQQWEVKQLRAEIANLRRELDMANAAIEASNAALSASSDAVGQAHDALKRCHPEDAAVYVPPMDSLERRPL